MDADALETLLGSNIRKHRLRLGFTQEQLAEFAGLSVSHVSDIELARTWVGADALVRIAAVLLVEPWVLLFDESLARSESAGDIVRKEESSRQLGRRIASRMNDIVAEEIRRFFMENGDSEE